MKIKKTPLRRLYAKLNQLIHDNPNSFMIPILIGEIRKRKIQLILDIVNDTSSQS